MKSSRALRMLAPRLPTTRSYHCRPLPSINRTMSLHSQTSAEKRCQSTSTVPSATTTKTTTRTSNISPQNENQNAKISCQCGTVTFRASLPKPLAVYICHCTECQKQSASAFGITAMFPAEGMWPLPEDIRPFVGKWTRVADSGNTLECYFCTCCGVRLLHRPILPDGTAKSVISVKGGCVDGLTLEGAKHVYVRSALVPVPSEDVLDVPGVKS